MHRTVTPVRSASADRPAKVIEASPQALRRPLDEPGKNTKINGVTRPPQGAWHIGRLAEAGLSRIYVAQKEDVAMRTDLGTYDVAADYEGTVSDSDLIGFNTPREIVHDPILTVARKRQLLAYWGSDIHAVNGAPALRSYAFGTAATIDEIKAALVELDEMVDLPTIPAGSSRSVSA
jgi:hypothetical protein